MWQSYIFGDGDITHYIWYIQGLYAMKKKYVLKLNNLLMENFHSCVTYNAVPEGTVCLVMVMVTVITLW